MGRIWSEAITSCKIAYKNGAGAQVTLSLGQVEARLFDLSFDPYHCPEMRWGAHPTQAAEMATCRTSTAHMKRFDDERTQRNAIDREYGAFTPFGWGLAQPEDGTSRASSRRAAGAERLRAVLLQQAVEIRSLEPGLA